MDLGIFYKSSLVFAQGLGYLGFQSTIILGL